MLDDTWRIIEPGDSVVVVLGAGATISEMNRPKPPRVPPPNDLNFLEVAESCCKQQTNTLQDLFNQLWSGGEPYPLHHQRMEQLFAGSFLKMSQTTRRTAEGRLALQLYEELVLLLRDTLYETTSKAEPVEHLDLFSRIVDREPKSLDFISFNYDCLADRALRSGNTKDLWNWSHKDGYGFKPSNQPKPTRSSSSLLLKLHGSMNWYISIPKKQRRIEYNPKADIYVPNPASRPGTPAWQRRQRTQGHKKTRIFPLMIPPVFEKATQISGKLGGVWDIAQQKLNSADVVLVWGYSLPATDYHAEMLFAQGARRSRSRLLVVNPEKSHLGRVTEVCGHRWSRWFFRSLHLMQALDSEPENLPSI